MNMDDDILLHLFPLRSLKYIISHRSQMKITRDESVKVAQLKNEALLRR